MTHPTSRRHFLATCAAAAAGALALPGTAQAAARRLTSSSAGAGTPHPTPRPGITGAKVLGAKQLAGTPDLIPLFDGVRAIPQVVDGIRCNCGCAGSPGFYSLLSCYEGEDAMALACPICQGQGRVAIRMHKAGKSLDEIRAAVDAQFG